jgi:predicted GIY-YIG superfamily endonuclease
MLNDRKTYCTYIMGSLSGTLYIGMTGNLRKRVFEHRFHRTEGFTDKYQIERLLYWESFDEVQKSDQSRKAAQRLAAIEENCTNRILEPALAGFGAGMVSLDDRFQRG